MDRLSFGETVQDLRRKKRWTVKNFIEHLDLDVSPAYITKIEIHGEIPNPNIICKIADAFDMDYEDLLSTAKTDKVKYFKESLEKKYVRAAGLYRIQREIK